jgi:stress response protein SCP2
VRDETASIWFVVNVYRQSFNDVKSAKINIMNKKDKVFSSFDLNFDEEMSKCNGNIACTLKRSEPGSK